MSLSLEMSTLHLDKWTYVNAAPYCSRKVSQSSAWPRSLYQQLMNDKVPSKVLQVVSVHLSLAFFALYSLIFPYLSIDIIYTRLRNMPYPFFEHLERFPHRTFKAALLHILPCFTCWRAYGGCSHVTDAGETKEWKALCCLQVSEPLWPLG